MSFLTDIAAKIQKQRKVKSHIRSNFPNEILLTTNKHTTESTHNSILYFTIQRCASRYVISILRKLISRSDITYIDLEGFFWRGGTTNLTADQIYKKAGYIYGPFYGLDLEEMSLPVPTPSDYNILLLLRDPRDVLTSYYFHHAYNIYDNPAQQEFIHERSRDATSKEIDEWVLEKAKIIQPRYKEYVDNYLGQPNVLFLKYEDMVSDFGSWLDKLIQFTGIQAPDDIVQSLIDKANFSVKEEKVSSHKRQVTPGDHKRKLKEETILQLNSEFSDILGALGYELYR